MFNLGHWKELTINHVNTRYKAGNIEHIIFYINYNSLLESLPRTEYNINYLLSTNMAIKRCKINPNQCQITVFNFVGSRIRDSEIDIRARKGRAWGACHTLKNYRILNLDLGSLSRSECLQNLLSRCFCTVPRLGPWRKV